MRLRIDLAYDGTEFHGWATQPGLRTVQEVVEDGVNGRLFDFFDTETLTRLVVEVLAAPAQFASMGARARAQVVARYDLRTRCLPQLIKLLLPP